jgi:gluconolactonase
MTKLYCLLLLLVPPIALAQSPVPSGAILEKIATGFQQPEGPVWKDGAGLLFSDIKRSTIYQWSQADSITTYLYPCDSSNGLTFDRQGRLILTQMLLRRVARQELNGTITPLASTYNGKKFNSPNDLVVKSDGSIFFTDPDFNIPTGQQMEKNFFRGVFRISPSGGLQALDSTTFNKPNGICFSPNESKLYVNESPLGKIYVWDVVHDSTITNKRVFYTIPLGGYSDGMKVDPDGNIFCTGPRGVWVISPSGVCLDTILMSINPSNCAWGDADRKTLYITGGNSIYRIRLGAATSVKDQGSLSPKTFELYGNYPNPFNPTTTIDYQIQKQSLVSLKIFDMLGREMATLVHERKEPEMYSVQWNASGFASGIYLCRLEAGSFTATKKLMLLR